MFVELQIQIQAISVNLVEIKKAYSTTIDHWALFSDDLISKGVVSIYPPSPSYLLPYWVKKENAVRNEKESSFWVEWKKAEVSFILPFYNKFASHLY